MNCKLLAIHITYGLTIRPLRLRDSSAYFGLVENNREWLSQYGDETSDKYPSFGSVEYSFVYPQNPDKRRYGIWNHNIFMGTLNLEPFDKDTVIIGYWLGEEFIRDGVMTKCVKILTKHAIEDLGYKNVIAHVKPGNRRSRAVLSRASYKLCNGDCANYQREDDDIEITYKFCRKRNKKPHHAGCQSFTND